jgi:hypothetical protein
LIRRGEMKKFIVLCILLLAGVAWGDDITIDGECCDCFGRSCFRRIDFVNDCYEETISARFGTWFGYGKDGPATFGTSMGPSMEEFLRNHKGWTLIDKILVNREPEIERGGGTWFYGSNGQMVRGTLYGGTIIENDNYTEIWLRRRVCK